MKQKAELCGVKINTEIKRDRNKLKGLNWRRRGAHEVVFCSGERRN